MKANPLELNSVINEGLSKVRTKLLLIGSDIPEQTLSLIYQQGFIDGVEHVESIFSPKLTELEGMIKKAIDITKIVL